MTSKNDLINDFRAEMTARSVRLTELESELHVWWEDQNAHRTEIKDVLRGHADRLAALEKARNQAATDPDELNQLRTANEQLLLQNRELTAANRRISEISTKRWKEIRVLRAENERLTAVVGGLRVRLTRVGDLADERWRDNNMLAAENARLRELLAVTDQHAEEIVRALAVAEGESK